MDGTDWMWCFEQPKEAAAEIDRLRDENIFLKEALRLAVKEIDNHHSDYHHLTPISILKKIRAPLGGMEE